MCVKLHNCKAPYEFINTTQFCGCDPEVLELQNSQKSENSCDALS